MNNWSGIGRLTRDPEMRYTGTGMAVANFTLAINRPFKNKDGEEEADFVNCVAFGNRAETISQYVKKGHRFGVNGRIQSGSYENKEGRTIYTTDVAVDSFTFLQPRDEQVGGAQQDMGQASNQLYGEPVDIKDDELPF